MLNHSSVPAACFTHPEISMVGLTEVHLTYWEQDYFVFPSHFACVLLTSDSVEILIA